MDQEDQALFEELRTLRNGVYRALERGAGLAVVEELLKQKASPNQPCTSPNSAFFRETPVTPLGYAVVKFSSSFGVPYVKALIEAGADVNLRDSKSDKTPLYIACENFRFPEMDVLIKANADVNLGSSKFCATPLLWAASCGWCGGVAVVDILIAAGADVNKFDAGNDLTPEHGPTALYYATENGDLTVMDALIKAGADVNRGRGDDFAQPLVAAISENRKAAMIKLLENGADPTGGRKMFATLYQAPVPLHEAIISGYADLAALLLDFNADPNKIRWWHGTPLNVAVRACQAPCIRVLAKGGANMEEDLGPKDALLGDEQESCWDFIDEDVLLETMQALRMAGGVYSHTSSLNEANMVKAKAWLDSVEELSALQICASLGNEEAFKDLLSLRECDPFCNPPLDGLAGDNPGMQRLCFDARRGWSPSRHMLFHPIYRSTVKLLLLIALRSPKIWAPTEVWFNIATQLGRQGWP